MSARPDMARGTTNAALAMNTNVREIGYAQVDTPLGARFSVRVVMRTGRTKEVALVKHRAYAGEIASRLEEARVALSAAAELIVRDRERT